MQSATEAQPSTPNNTRVEGHNKPDPNGADAQQEDLFLHAPFHSPTRRTVEGKKASLTTGASYFLSPPPPLRGNVLFSGVKRRTAFEIDGMDTDLEESPSRTYVEDDDFLATWRGASSSSEGNSSSEPDSMILSTPPQPQREHEMKNYPAKVQHRPRISNVPLTPESPAAKYGTGSPFIQMDFEDSPSDPVESP